MKNTLRLDHSKRTIIMDRTFAKYAANTMSTEYAHLQAVRQDYPNYTVTQRQIKRKATKECYRGLTYEYMEDYIKTHGSKEEVATNLADYKELKLISQCHSTSRRYPAIKRWFLAKYPEVMEFGVTVDDAAEAKVKNEIDEPMSKLAVAS
ncbi:MAG: hypothetical protein J6K55_10765 [Clostridia bacterium]|nr:hypothetical protein [Clostridia bacterium]